MPDVFDKKFFKVLLLAVCVVACSAFLMRIFMRYAAAYEINETIIEQTGFTSVDENLRFDDRNGLGSGAGGFYFTATDNFYVNIVDVNICRLYHDGDPQYDAGTKAAAVQVFLLDSSNGLPLATSTNYYAYDTFAYCGDDRANFYSFYFYGDSSTLVASGTDYAIAVASADTDADFNMTYLLNGAATSSYPAFINDNLYNGGAPTPLEHYFVNFRIKTTNDYDIDWSAPVDYSVSYGPGTLLYRNPQYCLVDNACNFWYKYTESQVGHTIYLIPNTDEAILDPAEEYVALYSPTSARMLEDYFVLSATSTLGTQSYCLFDDDPDDINDKYYCGISVIWTNETGMWEFTGEYDIESACDDVATSSGSYWDDFRYGVECGFNKSVYWLSRPHPDKVEAYYNNLDSLNNNFPLSLVNTFDSMFNEMASTTVQPGLEVPMLLWQGPDDAVATTLTSVVISSSTLVNAGLISNSLYETYYSAVETFLYLITGFYILIVLIKTSRKESNSA